MKKKVTILKFQTRLQIGLLEIEMYKSAKIISIKSQNDNLIFWAECNTNEVLDSHQFLVLLTGQDVPQNEYRNNNKVYYEHLMTIPVEVIVNGAYTCCGLNQSVVHIYREKL